VALCRREKGGRRSSGERGRGLHQPVIEKRSYFGGGMYHFGAEGEEHFLPPVLTRLEVSGGEGGRGKKIVAQKLWSRCSQTVLPGEKKGGTPAGLFAAKR